MARLLFIGDSLIAGYDWQRRIPFHEVQSITHPGIRTEEMLQLLTAKKDLKHADLIHICLGANNIYHRDFSFSDPLKRLVLYLQNAFPTAEIMISNIFPMPLEHIDSQEIIDANMAIAAFINQTGSCLLDMHRVFSGQPANIIFQNDNIHLTEHAYALWAQGILEHLAFLIEPD